MSTAVLEELAPSSRSVVLAGAPTRRSLAVALDSPWAAGGIALAVSAAVIGLRLAVVAHGDISRFIGLGMTFTDPSTLAASLHRFHGVGRDGQFFYRLALNPANLHHSAYGITLDTPYRLQRIGYPVLAWLTAGGRAALVPWSLVGVNLVALGSLGGLAAVLARDSGRHALFGLLVAGYWGFPFTLSWDLSGLTAVTFMVAGLLALRRERPVLAGLLLTGAVLTKETAMVFVCATAVAGLVGWRRRPSGWGRAQVAWALPAGAFCMWQLVVRVFSDGVGVTADTGSNLGLPLVAVGREVVHDLSTLGSVRSAVDLLQIALLLGLATAALINLRGSALPLREKLAFGGMTLLVVSLSSAVWAGQRDLRSLSELFVLAVVVLLGSRRRLKVPAILAAYMWALVALEQVLFL
jgi:hypothetical protein